jgi:hypothetical protein
VDAANFCLLNQCGDVLASGWMNNYRISSGRKVNILENLILEDYILFRLASVA